LGGQTRVPGLAALRIKLAKSASGNGSQIQETAFKFRRGRSNSENGAQQIQERALKLRKRHSKKPLTQPGRNIPSGAAMSFRLLPLETCLEKP
jgi:hypothetical protein